MRLSDPRSGPGVLNRSLDSTQRSIILSGSAQSNLTKKAPEIACVGVEEGQTCRTGTVRALSGEMFTECPDRSSGTEFKGDDTIRGRVGSIWTTELEIYRPEFSEPVER